MTSPLFDGDDSDDDGYEGISFEDKEAAKAVMEKIEAATRKLGLYVQTTDLVLIAEHGGEPRLGIAASFLIGDLAWTDRVQDPEADETADEIASMETHLTREKAQELRDRLRGRKDNDEEEPTDGD